MKRIKEHDAKRNAHIIACFVKPQNDFHFASYDRDGYWSSKWAKRDVIKTEQVFSEVLPDFLLGFYEVPETGITYYPRLQVVNTLQELGLC